MRQITKIARNCSLYVSRNLHNSRIKSTKLNCLHYISHHPNCSSNEIAEYLNVDKALISRTIKQLLAEGYISMKPSSIDHRRKELTITDETKAMSLTTHDIERDYYDWLLSDLTKDELKVFSNIIESLYQKSRTDRKNNFEDVLNYEKD